jgi:pimeloyl-ACP methyl ester carboxylesterase
VKLSQIPTRDNGLSGRPEWRPYGVVRIGMPFRASVVRFTSPVRLLLLVLVIAVFALPASAQDSLPRFEPEDCSFAAPAGANVECGVVVVPEDHANPDAADTVELAVAIYRSSADSPAADPVIFLQGGPGGGAVELVSFFYSSLVAPITTARDFIVFDQRGTGLSTPALNCPEVTETLTTTLVEDLTTEETSAITIPALNDCGDRLESEGINLAEYNSAASADDIAAIASALGYETVNLYGGSYGTRLALTVMRDYPSLVRSAVLDGVLGVEENQIGIMASKSDWALKNLFEICAADAACSAAYPDLEDTFWATVERLDETPAPITVTIPTTGETIETTVSGVDLIGGVFLALQQTTLIPTVPATIQSVADGDTSPLATFLTIPIIIGDGINIGMFMSVICAEEIPATTPAALDAELTTYPLLSGFASGIYFGDGAAITEVCNEWSAVTFDPIESEAVTSDVPTLLFSGQFDPATPPYFAERVAENLANSYNFVIPGAGHVASTSETCAMSMITTFMDDPSSAPDGSCLGEIMFSFSTPDSEIALVEVTNDMFGYTSLVPEGWEELGPGTYAASMTATTALIQLAIPGSIADAEGLLGAQFGIGEFPASVETIAGDGLEWQRYEATIMGQSGDLAMAEAGGSTYVVLLISTSSEREAAYGQIFLPVLAAFTAN